MCGPLLEVEIKLRWLKSAAVVARSTFRGQHVKSTTVDWLYMFGPLLEIEMMQHCTPLWREAHFQVKVHKAHHVRTTFGSCDVEKVHAVVARSTFWGWHVKNTTCSDHFWKLRLSWDDEKVQPLWREAHFQVKMFKTHHVRTTFGLKHTMFGPLLEVVMSKKCTPLWREAHFWGRHVKNTTCSDHFWTLRLS